ncbi:MAG TPA: hypothetical protein VGO62_09550 [Myxococcota bacterium]
MDVDAEWSAELESVRGEIVSEMENASKMRERYAALMLRVDRLDVRHKRQVDTLKERIRVLESELRIARGA